MVLRGLEGLAGSPTWRASPGPTFPEEGLSPDDSGDSVAWNVLVGVRWGSPSVLRVSPRHVFRRLQANFAIDFRVFSRLHGLVASTRTANGPTSVLSDTRGTSGGSQP